MSLNSSTYNRILSKGLEANLPGIEDGKLRFTTDTGRLFLDSGENRVEISDFVKDKTAQEIIQTEHPLPKFYLASDTNILYYFNNNTDQWNTVKVDIGLATTASEGLMPALEDDTSKFLRSDGTWADAGNVKLEELEREDYDELSEDEKNNGTLYMVKDKAPDVTDFPALIGEYYKIDNSKLNPNFDWGGIKFFFNGDDCSYCYGKYKNRGYDPNAGMHPYYDHGSSSSDTRNVLITQNMPTDTHYVGVYHSIYGLQCTSIIFIPKDIIDNGQAAMFLQFFYTSVECTIQYCHIWNDWTDESKYVLQSATLQPGSHPLDWSEGSIIDSGNLTLSWFANYPIIGGAYIGGEGLTQEEIDTYLATKEDNYPRYFNVNYFTYDHIFKEYDGTVMLNSIDYTGRIDTSKYALKSELSGYASTADLAGKQDNLTAGSNITFNGSTISANNTTYDLATTSSIGLMPALNGSTAKYLRSDGTWEIPTGGGGGSTISITPTLATGTKIADYSINGSTGELYAPNSGGGGSGGETTIDLLFETDTLSALSLNTPYNYLVDTDFFDYDLVSIMLYTPGDVANNYVMSPATFYPESIKKLDGSGYYMVDCTGYSARWTSFTFDSHTFTITGAQASGEDPSRIMYPYKIYGYKFGSGGSSGSGGFKETILWSGNDSATMPLTEAIDSFDAILFVGNASEGGSNYMVSNIWSVQDINNHINDGMKFCAIANDAWYVYVTAPNTQTFTKQNQNVLYISEIRGLNFEGGNGSSGSSAEVIPIEAGDNTTSRTFTFDKTPKFIKVYFEDTTLDGGWTLDSEIAWGQEYVNYKAHNMTISVTGLTGGLSSISYGSDGKSMTITSGNAFGSYNTTNGSGFMFVDYGSGSGGTEVEANPEDPATDVLNTIKIGDTVYNIPGSGSGGNTRSDVLWSGSETTNAWSSPIEIDDLELDNYDLLSVEINRGQQLLIKNQIPEGDDSGNECLAVGGYPTYQISDTTKTWPVFFNRTGNTLRIFTSTGQSLNITKVIGLKFGGLYTEELSDMTWTELTSVAGATSSAIPIPDGTKYLLLTSELGTNMNIVAYESIDTINKAITESGISTWNKGYEYYDISGNHTNIAMAVSNGEVTIKSGYQTVTAKVYALSGGVRPYENKVLAPMIYSTEEREVGTWIDNKPLYQKTYVKNNIVLTDNNWTNGILGTSGIYITDFKAYFGLENASNSSFPYNYYRNNSEFFTSVIDASHEDINVRPNMNAGVNVTAGTITIWYTKNSDVPGSGSYNTFGELMHHYSTEEKVVGTYLGNTLYERTISQTISSEGSYVIEPTGIENGWIESCMVEYESGRWFSENYFSRASTSSGVFLYVECNNGAFAAYNQSGATRAFKFTVRYTKTTS